ncbi:hypothetical protein [Nocardioides lianchengensis]|uniref:Uncharacterized protein n=1 Tax=Nocardioides lianchengensis TaxID=1045774 RepID=A0A1G6VBX2_9ACTN|nr:hypothetical protein [Nocardioides lianchengensis]NYG11218.1 hypothetical protein [Nocardioides lianchengensis]SDD50893.1 hypothetical protein SAMN05421872_108270 [Nocardioides lianchengensis]
MQQSGRTLTTIAGALVALGMLAYAVGVAISDPLSTGLGSLVLFSCASAALPLLAVGGAMWAIGARQASAPVRPS